MLINGQPSGVTTQEILEQLKKLPSYCVDYTNRWTSDVWVRGSPISAVHSQAFSANLLTELETISARLNVLPNDEPYGTFCAYHTIGERYSILGDPQKGIVYCNKALDIALNSRSVSHAGIAQDAITTIYLKQGDLEKYKIDTNINLQSSIASNNKPLELKSELALGSIYRLQKNHFKAVEHYNKAYILFYNKVDHSAQLIEQREYGTSDQEKIGTHCVTACIIVIIQDPDTKKATLGHIDKDTNVKTAMCHLLTKFPEDQKLNVYLLGGSDSDMQIYTSIENIECVIDALKVFANIDIKSADILEKHKAPAIVFDPQSAMLEYATPGKQTPDQSLRHARLYLEQDPQGLHEAFDFTVNKKIPMIQLSIPQREQLIADYFSDTLLPAWDNNNMSILGELDYVRMSYDSYKVSQEIIEFYWNTEQALVKQVFETCVKNYVRETTLLPEIHKQPVLDYINTCLQYVHITPAELLLNFDTLKSHHTELLNCTLSGSYRDIDDNGIMETTFGIGI